MTSVRDIIRAVVGGSTGYEPGLDALTVMAPDDVDPVLLGAVNDTCAALFRGGWQPNDLHRIVTRRGRPQHADLVVDAIAVHLRKFPHTAVDERWLVQARDLGALVWWTGDSTYLYEVAARWRSDRVEVLDAVLSLLTTLSELPPIEVLIPPPGTARAVKDVPGVRKSADIRLLDKVRALLAKAESTEFPAEAEAYTAKAQLLVTRHSIDEALLSVRAEDTGTVVPYARRIGVDHPYEQEKAGLLDAVARANRCHAVWSQELGFVTVFGFDADIDAVDLLHTSLLVQANRSMSKAEPPGGKAGRARLKAFRQSFLVAFTVRIGERLADAADTALADATQATTTRPAISAADLLPVLASRDALVRETMEKTFPSTIRARGSRVDSREGWESGRAAADQAALHRG
jgi:hypothetical protein